MDFYLDTTIQELLKQGIISVRTFNCLRYARMGTLGDVIDNITTPMDLMKLRNFGRKSYAEIEPILTQTIREQTVAAPENKEARFNALGETFVKIVTDAHAFVTEGDTEVKAYLRAAYPRPYNMHELVMDNIEDMLTIVEGYSREENLEIRLSYKHFMELVLKGLEESPEAIRSIYDKFYIIYKRKETTLLMEMEHFSNEQVAKYFLSPSCREYLEELYQEQVELKLSVRGQNFVAKFLPHFSDLIKYAGEPFASYKKICPGQSMMKTLTEIFHFNQNFSQDFSRVSKLTDEEIKTEILKYKYPFLMSRQRQFVSDFEKEYHHAPLFFLMLNYLRLSENRSNKVYCLMYGIFDGKRRTLNETGEAMNLSRERVRQIMTGTIEVQESALVKNYNRDFYKGLLKLPFICEKTNEYIKLRDTEHLPSEFEVVAPLVKLLGNFEEKVIEGHTILINNDYCDLKLDSFLDTLLGIVKAKYSSDTYVPFDSFLSTIPKDLWSDIKDIIRYVATEINNALVTEDEKLFLQQNYVDVPEELYKILARKGEPMHLEDIFNEFKAHYPDHKYTTSQQIKTYLLKHKHIKPVGMTSCYGLDTWTGVYFGSIRDLLIDLLNASDVPLHIDHLYEGVSRHYPNTTKASLVASMDDGNLQRFVEFEGNYFGLAAKEYPSMYVEATSVQRYRFEVRFKMFRDFVETYHRFPTHSGSSQEASLMRWYYNINNGVLKITEEQKEKLEETLRHYDELGYPRSSTEYEFFIKCQDVKDFIRQYHILPTNSKAPELYAWLRRSRDNYDSYTDKRRQYLTDLLNFVLSFGFSI